MLALLIAGTSWAVASWVSAWLVPPYLILMALILSPSTPNSTGRHQREPASEGLESSDNLRPASTGREASTTPILDGWPGLVRELRKTTGRSRAPRRSPPRARRGKARAKKAKPLPELAEATWVQVAPGKFVRVEAADGSTGQAGPHSPVGVPVPRSPTTTTSGIRGKARTLRSGPKARPEDEATPAPESEARPEVPIEGLDPLEGPIEDAGPAFDPVEGPEGDPTGAFESGPSIAYVEENEDGESRGQLRANPPTADGNAPAGRS